MAHLIAPPSSVQPMTREDIAVVQAEKRVDAATREQLVRVYGDARDPHGRPIDLTRPSHRNWRCAACGNMSTDIRHLCGTCLSPEPGYVNARFHSAKSGSKPTPNTAEVPRGVSVLRAGTNSDPGVRLINIAATKRTYRTYYEPHVPTIPAKAAARDAMEVREGDEDAVWDDEPDCGEGHSCRPGGGGGRGDDDDDDDHDDHNNGGANSTLQLRDPHDEAADGGFTHFVSLPLGKQPAITANATRVLEDLRSFVGARAPADDTEAAETTNAATPELVTSTPKLHMTLLLLNLPRREDVEFACELLQGPFAAAWAAVKEKAVAARGKGGAGAASPALSLSGDSSLAPAHRHPLLRLGGGLQVMPSGTDNDQHHPDKAAVVYMGIDDPVALATVQQLQKVLHESFAELIHDRDAAARSRQVLHVTLMNKKWRRARGAKRPFDARPVLDAFADAAIGAGDDGRQFFEMAEVELCSMRRHDVETGTYVAEATMKV